MKEQRLKIYEALRWASSFLEEHGYEQPIAEILLRHFLGMDRTKMFQILREELSLQVEMQFKESLNEIVKGVPVQHITGVETFYGREFKVNEDVLIPRPETEELIEGLLLRIQQNFPNKNSISVVDIGTGSGAIAITLAKENRNLNVTTVDISEAAINVAKQNAENLGAEIRFLNGDLLSPIIAENQTVDVLVSNPPYISEADFSELADNVRLYEPTLALVGGETGYELYERLINQIPELTAKPTIIAFEVGVGQSIKVEALIKASFPTANTEIVFDINRKDRIVFAIL